LIFEQQTNPIFSARILLVEDDEELAEEMLVELKALGVEAAWERTLDGAAERIREAQYSLLVLDRMIGQLDSLTLVEELRKSERTIPILLVSALYSVDDRIFGLSAGGDDYLIKPFALGEFSARVQALLRRPTASYLSTKLFAGPLEADLVKRTVTRAGREIILLPREFMILEYFMRRPNQIVTREMLLRDIWKYQFIPKTNVVDVHVGKLRRKIDCSDEALLLHSVRAAGFMLKTDV